MTSLRLSMCFGSALALSALALGGGCNREPAANEGDGGIDTDLGGASDLSNSSFVDDDGDSIVNELDNCPNAANIDQADFDGDGQGDPCDPDPPPTTCGDDQPAFRRDKPNIFIILDRSLSMGMGMAPTKWTQANSALDQVSANIADKIRVGLAVFPGTGGGNCEVPTQRLAMGEHTTTELQASYAAPLAPGGLTPMRTALATARTSNWTSDASDPENETRSKNILFITDGVPNCAVGHEGDFNYSDQLAVLTEVDAIKATGTALYVVGFGSGVDASNLNAMAIHGGTDNPNDPTNAYYQANNGAQLEQALLQIGQEVITCDLYVTGTPADPNRIYVDQAGKHLVRDGADGFTYNPTSNTITLNGQACLDLKASVGTQPITIIFGCPTDGSSPIL